MGVYGNKIIEACHMDDDIAIIESCFSFLNESTQVSMIRYKINQLKEKDTITEQDMKDVINDIKSVSDLKHKEKLFVSLANVVLACIGFVFSVEGKYIKGMICSIVSLFISGYITSTSYTHPDGETYAKMIKLQATINTKIKKLEAVENLSKKNEDMLQDLCKTTELLEKMRSEFRNKINIKEAVNESVVLEYKGNDAKNEAFRIICNDMADICEFFLREVQIQSKYADKMFECVSNSAKSNSNPYEVSKKIKEMNVDCSNEIKKLESVYKINNSLSFAVFSKELQLFNSKYSQISMENKKRIATKLEETYKVIKSIASMYSDDNSEKISKLYDDIIISGNVSLKSSYNAMILLCNDIVSECNKSTKSVKHIINMLNIKTLENSKMYRLLNPIKK